MERYEVGDIELGFGMEDFKAVLVWKSVGLGVSLRDSEFPLLPCLDNSNQYGISTYRKFQS